MLTLSAVHFPAVAKNAREWRWRITSVCAVLALVRLVVVASASYPAGVGLFEDDAFYYFGTAAHLAAGDGSTFNGVDLTNGYHPLWQAVLVPVFAVASGHAALVLVTLVSAALFLGAGCCSTASPPAPGTRRWSRWPRCRSSRSA